MILDVLTEGLTFDDVLLEPARSEVLPTEVDTRTCLTRQIGLNIPIVDCQQETAHLASFGARPIPRRVFAAHLAELIHSTAPPRGWEPRAVQDE